MNTINFIQTGGVPFTNDVAQEFENAYKIFNAYGALAGDKTIISGCVENGSSVSDGFIYPRGVCLYLLHRIHLSLLRKEEGWAF